MTLSKFTIFKPDEFVDYVMRTQFNRPVSVIQNHHTFKPGYQHLTDSRGEMYWLESMRTTHINDRKWSDIGQNITTFKSGNIAVCRPIDSMPAGIYGANTGAICMEHMGDFDSGKDQMSKEHKDSIILANAVLCLKFGIQPEKWKVVYHHWYSPSGAKFTEADINSGATAGLQKSCPGTAFFGGNTINAAEHNFYPLIQQKMQELSGAAPMVVQGVPRKVAASTLNVRSGPGKNFSVVRTLKAGMDVLVFDTNDQGWSLISNTAQEWVATNYLGGAI
ncbi:MAG: SH3 domain-containing protein [Bacteroidetes bacterium]|nr:SH3 domain-containing protein [Bacteroidota bacterium]